MLEQISIEEYMNSLKPASDALPCDSCVYDNKGCCGYDIPHGRYCENGNAYIKRYDLESDERIGKWEVAENGKTILLGIPTTDSSSENWKTPVNIDRVAEGIYDGKPAEIGLSLCVYGLDEAEIWVPLMWRPTK